jgi:hypothetical protein
MKTDCRTGRDHTAAAPMRWSAIDRGQVRHRARVDVASRSFRAGRPDVIVGGVTRIVSSDSGARLVSARRVQVMAVGSKRCLPASIVAGRWQATYGGGRTDSQGGCLRTNPSASGSTTVTASSALFPSRDVCSSTRGMRCRNPARRRRVGRRPRDLRRTDHPRPCSTTSVRATRHMPRSQPAAEFSTSTGCPLNWGRRNRSRPSAILLGAAACGRRCIRCSRTGDGGRHA